MRAQGQFSEDMSRWLTAEEVADRLKIKRETVYAYVSRGRLRSRRADDGRGSVFNPADVERLSAKVKGARRRQPDVLESEITLIAADDIYYRGHSARELALTATFEQVACLLWGSTKATAVWVPSESTRRFCRKVIAELPSSVLPVDLIKVVAACVATVEPPDWDFTPDVIATTAQRVLATLLASLPEQSPPADAAAFAGPASPMAALLWSRLCDRPPAEAEVKLLNATMIILADHDLASATFVARTAARAGVEPSGIVRLGIDVGSGPVKGAASLAIETLLHNLNSRDGVEAALTRRLRQGDPIPGFGHPVYPEGDTRASFILDELRKSHAGNERLATVEEVIQIQLRRGLPPPNAGFALAALTYVLGMVPGAGEAIFVLSRAAGWIAHAIEEYNSEPLERLQSVYVGPPV
ncbi:citrate synthase [Acrocarpospora macrocephala]|uniref:citrate synthase (unknown stereospecificity) n=1 Tax=Acrocarpospora macrocephala TaxID=150177 RepID=A0A5M3X2P3_9ACTN|nr:citrate synthase [Acrocarpospora macrocephala]GES13083.1 citrate synthase [Acrocarpospora macrocephala]